MTGPNLPYLPFGVRPPQLKNIDLSENSRTVFMNRYVRDEWKETPEDVIWRVASNVAMNHDDAVKYYELIRSKDFLPNSPTFTGAGTPLGNLSACFVLPLEDSMDSIMSTLRNAAFIQKAGGGVGFAFSNLRAKGTKVSTSNGSSSGPIGFLEAYDKVFDTIKQGGIRRCANMGVMHVSHPNIVDFIKCKSVEGNITNFNISVAIDDDFIDALFDANGKHEYELTDPHTKEVVEVVDAREIFKLIVHYSWLNGEPGVIFIDAMNGDNPIPHVGEYQATNPCAEQPLLPYESCNLGSINLSNHVKDGKIDWERLGQTVHLATAFLDDVVEENKYVPDVPKLREAALNSRRIGLGFMGFADMLIKLGVGYGEEEGFYLASQISAFMRYHAMRESCNRAIKYGSFPLLQESIYDDTNIVNFGFNPSMAWHESQMKHNYRPELNWDSLLEDIKNFGIRNACTTTLAPTGTIATVAGVEGYGIEPIFAFAYTRHMIDRNTNERVELKYISPLLLEYKDKYGITDEMIDHVIKTGTLKGSGASDEACTVFACSSDIKPIDHVWMQAAAQSFIDSGISKTINMPNEATEKDVAEAIIEAYGLGCKGITIYRTGSREVIVLEVKREQESACPNCGETNLVHAAGCTTCPSCTWSVCTVG